MAITELYADSATIGSTEYSCPNDANYSSGSPITTVGIYQVFIDSPAMAAGDQFEIKVYRKVNSGSSAARVIHKATLDGASGPLVLPSLVLRHAWDITIKKLAGTDRAFEWSLEQIA